MPSFDIQLTFNVSGFGAKTITMTVTASTLEQAVLDAKANLLTGVTVIAARLLPGP